MTQTTSPDTDRPFIGIALLVGFCVTVPFGDALIKLIGETMPLIMVLLARFIGQVIFVLPILFVRRDLLRGIRHQSAKAFWLIAFRGLINILGVAGMYFGLKYMPLAETVAISFVFPLLILLMGKFLLGEQVGPYRLTAVFVGFIGTLMIVQPNFAAVGWAALWPLATAFSFASFALVSRLVSKELDPVVMQVQAGLVALIPLILATLFLNGEGWKEFDLVIPNQNEALMLVLMAAVFAYSIQMVTTAFKFAPASMLAPLQYLELPCSTLIGWLIFSHLPNGLAALGICITIATGLYIIHREHKARSQPA